MLRKNNFNPIQITICALIFLMVGIELLTLVVFRQSLHLPVIIGIGCGISMLLKQKG
ncbi:hypothetical protein Hs30E_11010 [Lactococcus hodotermopsidis]|uniref:Uncharacterized protein n=1 Tax=Pseudolactococcus hodotermopsidis TaxID=2709157 RepID=A0A6A0BAW7_9LACT|nr:hypothetical protein Hs30E_11010 [Lactococcus hodotermopsidis]